MKAVVTENLSKIYAGGNKAVDHISFDLEQGEVFGFLGPNGAGKTTTIKLLCGMLEPTAGRCRVFDLDPAENPEKLHQLAGVITEHAQMYEHLTGMDNLMFYGAIYGMSSDESRKRAMALLEQLDLQDASERKLSAFSTGMRQRLSLARAMMHSPRILFLDEPTSGLDPESAQNVNSMIGELAAKGTTIFLCTHQLRYAQEICTTYGLMNKGNLFATGTIDTLRTMVSSKVKVRVKASDMPEHMGCQKVGEHMYEIEVDSQEAIPRIVKAIVEAGGNLYEVLAEELSLEDIYFSLMDSTHEKGSVNRNEL